MIDLMLMAEAAAESVPWWGSAGMGAAVAVAAQWLGRLFVQREKNRGALAMQEQAESAKDKAELWSTIRHLEKVVAEQQREINELKARLMSCDQPECPLRRTA